MSESSTPFEGENLASYEALKTAIRLAEGFTLIFAVTNSELGAQEVMRRLWRDGVRYRKVWLRDPERPLIDQVLEKIQSSRSPVMILGLEGLTTMQESTNRSLQNLNWTRPQWTKRLRQAIILWITDDMEATFAREAPDLWRFRSLRVEFAFAPTKQAVQATELRRQLKSIKLAPRVRLVKLHQLFSIRPSQKLAEEISVLSISNGIRLEDRWAGREVVENLQFGGTAIADDYVSLVSGFPKLSVFDLNDTNISDQGIATIDPRQGFWLISLARTAVSDKSLDFLRGRSDIYGLDLNGTHITDKGLESLTGLSGLGLLMIAETKVTDEGLKNLIPLRDLTSLFISDNIISEKGKNYLTQLESIKIIEILKTTSYEDAHERLRNAFDSVGKDVVII